MVHSSAESGSHHSVARIRSHEMMRLPRTVLRETMPNNRTEVARLFEAENSPYMMQVVGDVTELNKDIAEQKKWMQDMKDRSTVTFRTAINPKYDHAIAWVRIDQGTPVEDDTIQNPSAENVSEERARYVRLLKKTHSKEILTNETPDPCEITYAPVPGNEHLIKNVLQDTCRLIEEQDKKNGLWSDTDKNLRRPVVVFEGDSEIAQFSRDALLAAGFELKSGDKLINYRKGERNDTRMYVLNWDKFLLSEEGKKMTQSHTPLNIPRLTQLAHARELKQLAHTRATIKSLGNE